MSAVLPFCIMSGHEGSKGGRIDYHVGGGAGPGRQGRGESGMGEWLEPEVPTPHDRLPGPGHPDWPLP